MSWLTDVAEHLEDTIATYTVGTNIFYAQMPETPDACIACYDAGGSLTPEGEDVPLAEYRLEVRTRGTTEANARSLAATVSTQLHAKTEVTMNTTTSVLWCRLDAEPVLLYADQRRRAVYLSRYTLRVRRASYRST